MFMSSLVSICLLMAPMVRNNALVEQKTYQIEMSLYHAETIQSIKKVTKVLSNPTLSVLNGKSGRIIVGGEQPIPFTKPVQFEPTGVIVSIDVTENDQKTCIVKLNAEDRNVQTQTDELLVQTSNQIRLQGKIELNKPMSLRVVGGEEGKQTWLDFRVTEIQR